MPTTYISFLSTLLEKNQILLKMPKNIDKLKALFWDYKWESVIKNLDSPFVISRVLELGNPEQFKILSKILGDEIIKKFLVEKGKKLLSHKSLNFWNIYYAQKSFTKTQKSH